MWRKKKSMRWNTMGILAVGFLGVILSGGILLWLPVCNRGSISFIDALFTSVSCDRTCNNNAGSAVYAARAGDPSAADPDRRAWSDCLCYGVFFASQEEDHGKGAGSDPGDV